MTVGRNSKLAPGAVELGEGNFELGRVNFELGAGNFELGATNFELADARLKFGQSSTDLVASKIKRYRGELKFFRVMGELGLASFELVRSKLNLPSSESSGDRSD